VDPKHVFLWGAPGNLPEAKNRFRIRWLGYWGYLWDYLGLPLITGILGILDIYAGWSYWGYLWGYLGLPLNTGILGILDIYAGWATGATSGATWDYL
jgi:hypothetical protein